jgi:predicted metallopeptidase
MGIRYELAPELQKQVNEISGLIFPHVKLDSVVCLRSHGSSSRGTIARCHALGKAMQLALGRRGFYVIEVISKRFDKMSEEEKTKTLIHELMHIPKSFGGGFIHHNIVHERNVEKMYQYYISLKKKESFVNSIMNGEGSDRARERAEKISEDISYEKIHDNTSKKKSWWF